MKSLERMIDKGATMCGSKSALARQLGWTAQRLSDWEAGRRPMPDEQIDALATLTGYDPIKALGEYHHEWMRKKTGGFVRAGIAVASSFLVVALSGVSDARGSTPHDCRGQLLTHYAQIVAWMRRWKLIASSLRRDGRRNPAPTGSEGRPAACKGAWLAVEGSDVAQAL